MSTRAAVRRRGDPVRAVRALGEAHDVAGGEVVLAVGRADTRSPVKHEQPLLLVLVVVRAQALARRELEQLDRQIGAAGGLADVRHPGAKPRRVLVVVLDVCGEDIGSLHPRDVRTSQCVPMNVKRRRRENEHLVLDLARELRDHVLPELGSHAGREHHGDGAGGDVTFAVDEVAERALGAFVADYAPHMTFYSEDRGLVPASDATHVLVVDPIDGTRPAMAGLESACVAVALAPLGDGEPTMADVEVGCVVEIKTGDWYLARRGAGVTTSRRVALSANAEVGRMFWGYGFRGRPARETVEVLAELIDASSVGGGTFELGSQAFAMTRIVTGQLDAVVEVGSRLVDEVPGMRDAFLRGGRRTDPQQLSVRPRGAVAVPRRGGRGRHRRLGRAARRTSVTRVRTRVPDVLDLLV